MAKKDNSIRQVHEFMAVGADASGLPSELAENHDARTLGNAGQKEAIVEANTDNCDPFAGPRDWKMKWFGPFYSASLPPKRNAGVYLVYVGNYPLFVSSSANIEIAITRHMVFVGGNIIPIDLLGREILHYVNLYRQPLSIKTALIFEHDKLIHPRDHIPCYRRAAAAIAYCHAIPCNKYARLKYEFETLSLSNSGKFFPLLEHFKAEPIIAENDKKDI